MRPRLMLVLGAALAAAGCPHPTTKSSPPAGSSWSRELATGAGPMSMRGVGYDTAGRLYVAMTTPGAAATADTPASPAATVISAAMASGDPRWTWTVAAQGGPVAGAGARVVAAIAPGPGVPAIVLGDELVRGDPGAALVGLDAETGALAWSLALGATRWCVVSAIAGHAAGDAVVVGSFAGTLRVGDAVVTSGGNSDAFALRVGRAGEVRWLVRGGGNGADAFTAVAIGDEPTLSTIAVAGSITGEADLRGTPLVAHNDRLPSQDVAVAVLDGDGRPRWGKVFGGDSDDLAAGVGILSTGAVAVAATVRDVVDLGVNRVVRGTSDALVAVFDAAGTLADASLVGGLEYDGARGLAIAAKDTIVVGGFYRGVIRGPAGDLTADGDDGFLARLDATAHVLSIEPLTGPGREEVVGLTARGGTFALAVAHTAGLSALGVTTPAPADSAGGVVLYQRH
jgi:hypothetical protein